MRRKAWGLFGFAVSITHNFVFITHNSKMVGPITEKFVWILFLVFVFITQFSNFWVMSNGNWKHILGLFSFHNSIFNSIFVINLLFSRNVGLFWLFIYLLLFFWNRAQPQCWNFFFFNFFGNKVTQNWVMSAKRVGLGKLGYFKRWVMSDEWWVMKSWVRSDEWWNPKLEDTKPPLFMALIIISESPSTITCSRFSSLAEHMALRAANTSTISTKVGNEIVCVKAATTRPLSFLTIASRLAKLFALKVVPSKLIFN